MVEFSLKSTPILYEAIRLVKGAANYLVIDLQRQSYFKVDKFTYYFLCEIYHRQSIKDLFAKYSSDYHDLLIKNLNQLIDHELIFITNNPEWFPYISDDWDSPQLVTNAIFDVSPLNFTYFEIFIDQIVELGCQHLQLRDWKNTSLKIITKLIQLCMNKDILGIELISNYHKFSTPNASDLLNRFPKINHIILFDAPNDQIIEIKDSDQIISYSTTHNLAERGCGCINTSYFSIGTELFFESKKYNSCLNRKISVDHKGFIKNCPSMLNHYGHLSIGSISDLVSTKDFKKYWDINKDKIHVCKDCEFRYICTDCRAYVEDPDDILSKPLKCGYNPYTGEWSEWSTNPLKQKAINYYGMREMVEGGGNESK